MTKIFGWLNYEVKYGVLTDLPSLLLQNHSDYGQHPFITQVLIAHVINYGQALVSLDTLLFLLPAHHCSSFFFQLNNNDKPMGMAVGMPDMMAHPAAVDLAKNPLAETHEFKQACSLCFVKTGEKLFDN